MRNILDQRSLQWVFVGGKGGVGKTTTSCSLAVQLAKVRRNVLVVSTDPAHNLSDAFAQKFSKEPTLVTGYTNLYCMEVDSSPSAGDLDLTEASAATGIDLSALEGGVGGIMNDLIKSVPGIDEAMAFGELMKMVRPYYLIIHSIMQLYIINVHVQLINFSLLFQVQEMNYDIVVFDTAPTGHTLRLLSFPKTMETAIGKLLALKVLFNSYI